MGKNELITMKKFISIDMQATGKQIKKIMLQQGYTINDIKEYLYLKNPVFSNNDFCVGAFSMEYRGVEPLSSP